MNNTNTGRKAEQAAADYLKKVGFSILSSNWRNRWCEIDLVASYKGRIYFVEVKYRKNNTWGDGTAYITDKKLKQMTFAAELWVSSNNWNGDYCLAVAPVSGVEFSVDDFIEI